MMEPPSDESLDLLQGVKLKGKFGLARNHIVNYARECKTLQAQLESLRALFVTLGLAPSIEGEEED